MPPKPHTIQITTLQTTIPVEHEELEAVKEALGLWLAKEKKCPLHTWIHNHKSEDNPEYEEQNYPLVQLRSRNGHLLLWGMQQGSVILQELMMTEMFRGFQYRGKQFHVKPGETKTVTYNIAWCRGKHKEQYELNYFVAFKPGNFKDWQALPDAAKRMERLQELIVNNIAMYCKAAGFKLDKEKLKLSSGWVWATRWVKIKEYKVLAFTLTYACNLLLPNGIALGRQTKLGYGWQTQRSKKAG
ncbi:MAG: hypothetical protein IPN39_12730 [Chitinophagaceae bacterium]|nr:hypothetical protein [Chitinophagaceae bacterium]